MGRIRTWTWRIESEPISLRVKLFEGGFRSEKAAKLAGEKALRKLLDGIAEELAKDRRDTH